jgi:tetratricopeptide (TPR) repeat protein
MSLKDKGKKLLDEGKFVEAFPILKKATQHTKDDFDLWSNFASAALQCEEFDEAIHAYKQTIRLAPRSDWAWRQYANALLQAERLDEAEKALQNAKSLNGESAWLWRHYATLHQLRNDIRKEIEALEILDLLGETDANDLNRLGIAHHDQKNYARALEYYHRSALNARITAPLFNMGLVFNDPEISQDADAADAYRRALILDPKFERAKEQLEATKRKLVPLAKRVRALKPLIDPTEYFQFYLSPFEALQITPADFQAAADTKLLQKAKKRLLQEIELNEGRLGWLDNYAIDKSRAVAIDDDLLNEQTRRYHTAIFDNSKLLRFLTRGELEHFLYSENYFPQTTIELMEAEPSFRQFISKPFAQQYNLLLSRALDRKLLDAIEALFDGRRWVLPEHDDICFQGANKRISALVELLRQIETKAVDEKPSFRQLEDILRQHQICDIFNLLPTQFRTAQTEAVAHIRSLAVTCYNKYGDTDLSKSILDVCKRFQFKSVELNKRLEEDFETISELITQERQYETKLTFGKERTFEITKNGIRDGGKFLPASSLTKLRWGITVTGYVGAEQYNYFFQATDENHERISVAWSCSKYEEPTSTKHFNSIIQAALAYLARPILDKIQSNLDNGNFETIGPWKLTSAGISYRTDSFLFVTERFLSWKDLSSEMQNGQIVVCRISDSRNRTFASIRDTDNAVLIPILSQIMKERLDGQTQPSTSEPGRSYSKHRIKLQSVFFGLIALLFIYFLFYSQPSSQKHSSPSNIRSAPSAQPSTQSIPKSTEPPNSRRIFENSRNIARSKLNNEIEKGQVELRLLESDLRSLGDRLEILSTQIDNLKSSISQIERNAEAGVYFNEWDYERKIQEHNELAESYNTLLRTYNLRYAAYKNKLDEVNEKIRLFNQLR